MGRIAVNPRLNYKDTCDMYVINSHQAKPPITNAFTGDGASYISFPENDIFKSEVFEVSFRFKTWNTVRFKALFGVSFVGASPTKGFDITHDVPDEELQIPLGRLNSSINVGLVPISVGTEYFFKMVSNGSTYRKIYLDEVLMYETVGLGDMSVFTYAEIFRGNYTSATRTPSNNMYMYDFKYLTPVGNIHLRLDSKSLNGTTFKDEYGNLDGNLIGNANFTTL